MSLTTVKGSVWNSAENNLAVNVKDAPFNAKGDGVTDDTAAIQAAIDSGAAEVQIPEGIYLADALTPASTLRVLRGIGYPVLTAFTASTKVIEGTSGDNLLITGLNLTGKSGSTETSNNQLINLTSYSNLRIKDNIFTNGYHRAIYLIDCNQFEVSGNSFLSCSNGPYFTGCTRGVIAFNAIRNSQQSDDTFKIGIALQTFNATHGLNQDISIIGNNISGLADSQGILGHGGIGIVVSENIINGCSQGINFNRQTSGDDIIDVTISNNRLKGISGGVTYAPAGDVGITISATGETCENVIISNNTIRNFNLKSQSVNLGGISLIAAGDIVIQGNSIRNCDSNGIVFSGADSGTVMVTGNYIHDITNTGGVGGIKIDSPTVVSGLFKDNDIRGCDRSYRLETSSLPDLVIEDYTDLENTGISTGTTSSIYNGVAVTADGDSTPTVKYGVRSLTVSNSGATNITNLDDGIVGQIVAMRFTDGNTTIKDAATGGSFQLAGNADFTSSNNDALVVMYSGAAWIELSRSLN